MPCRSGARHSVHLSRTSFTSRAAGRRTTPLSNVGPVGLELVRQQMSDEGVRQMHHPSRAGRRAFLPLTAAAFALVAPLAAPSAGSAATSAASPNLRYRNPILQ